MNQIGGAQQTLDQLINKFNAPNDISGTVFGKQLTPYINVLLSINDKLNDKLKSESDFVNAVRQVSGAGDVVKIYRNGEDLKSYYLGLTGLAVTNLKWFLYTSKIDFETNLKTTIEKYFSKSSKGTEEDLPKLPPPPPGYTLEDLSSPNSPTPGLQNPQLSQGPLDNPVVAGVDVGKSVYDQIPDTDTTLERFVAIGMDEDDVNITDLKKFRELTTDLNNLFTPEKKGLTVKVGSTDINIFAKYEEVKTQIAAYINAAQLKVKEIKENFETNRKTTTDTTGKPRLMFHENKPFDTSAPILNKGDMIARVDDFNSLVGEYNTTNPLPDKPIAILTGEQRTEILSKINGMPESWTVDYYVFKTDTVSGIINYSLVKQTPPMEIKTLNDYARTVLFTVKNVNIYMAFVKKTLEALGTQQVNSQVGPQPTGVQGAQGGNLEMPDKYRYNGKLYKVREGPRGGMFIVVDGKKVRVSS